MASLGNKNFTANGSVDSDHYTPDNRQGLRFTFVGTPSQPGDCRIYAFHRTLGSGTAVAQAAAVSGNANAPNIQPVEGAFGGSDIVFFLRYTNTNNTAGAVRFDLGEAVAEA
jgi:hypothetical protein